MSKGLALREIIDMTNDVYGVGLNSTTPERAELAALSVMVVAAVDRLEELGMSREQIEELMEPE